MDTAFFYSGAYNYITRDNFLKDYNVVISDEFMICADEGLRKDFVTKTGLKINKNISFTLAGYNTTLNYIKGAVSQFTQQLFVNHNWNPVTVKWKSRSGRIYEMHDTDIDCNDLDFWFDNLDVPLIYKQMFPGTKLPFTLKNLSYELVVTRINLDCAVELELKDEYAAQAVTIEAAINNYIADFNSKSEKGGRKHGVIHNWKTDTKGNKLIYDIDLGSTGPYFFKKLLPYLSELNYFSRVEIC